MVGDPADKTSRKPQAKRTPEDRLRSGDLGAFFRPSEVDEAGITRHQLRTLVRRGVVEHVARGLYRFTDREPTEHYSLAMACARVPNSVVCLLSALQVYGIGTQVPAAVWLAIPHKARRPRLPGIKMRLLRFSGTAWMYGVFETRFEGVPAKITSPARTIVDCFRFEHLIGREAALEALHDALQHKKVTTDALMRAMEVLPARRLHAALETMAP